MSCVLAIHCGSSTFSTALDGLKPWRPVLDCADAISLICDNAERVHVRLDGLRRWIAFERTIGGSPFAVIGYQETVGARRQDNTYTGGSNRKVLAWVGEHGGIFIGESPDVPRATPCGTIWLQNDGKTLTGDDVPEVLK